MRAPKDVCVLMCTQRVCVCMCVCNADWLSKALMSSTACCQADQVCVCKCVCAKPEAQSPKSSANPKY